MMYMKVFMTSGALCFHFVECGKKGEVQVMEYCRIRQLHKIIVMT